MPHQSLKFSGLPFLLLCLSACPRFAQSQAPLTGQVTDIAHHPLAYAGVYVLQTGTGTTTNAEGRYALDLPPGTYQLVCRYLGYEKQQKTIRVTHQPLTLDFTMAPVSLQIGEVVVHGGPDPAYAVIKKAIQKRAFYQNQSSAYRCKMYVKGVVKTQDAPDRLLGAKIDYTGTHLDSTHSGIFFVSESWSDLQVDPPHQVTQQVIASRQSGGGLGFDFPVFIDLYANNVSLGSRRLTPRGYVSPIADHALRDYRYHLEGTFNEDGHRVYKIQVLPKRRHEPLFRGYINIMEGSWRIHSVDLTATRTQGLQLLDSLNVRQIHAKIHDSVWRITNQSVEFRLHQFGFPLQGTFLSVYTDYARHPKMAPGRRQAKIIVAYDSLATERSTAYWDRLRPIPLEASEQEDFRYKDSLRTAKDSAKQQPQPPSLTDVLWKGYRHPAGKPTGLTFQWSPLLKQIAYNTVEGLVTQAEASWQQSYPSGASWKISPTLRYGWNNHHFNAFLKTEYRHKKQFGILWGLSGGKRVSQFNPGNPIDPLINSLYTLLAKENYLKIYEKYFVRAEASGQYLSGFRWQASLSYEDRHALHNTTSFSLIKNKDKAFSPNHPQALAARPFQDHRAFLLSLNLRYQPGLHYIQYPDHLAVIKSQAPVWGVGYTRGISGLLGSRIAYDKWYANLRQDINVKRMGSLTYQVQIGGFLNDRSVSIADLTHFNGNQTLYMGNDMQRFQLIPYYQYSNDAPFYSTLHLEYHLNGLLTNKIPLLNRLRWTLVAGTNALYVRHGPHYGEAFAGLENIAQLFRVEFVTGYAGKGETSIGLRIGWGGLLSGALTGNHPEHPQKTR